MEVITSHIQADFDAFASMLAARRIYRDAILVFPGAQEKNLRDYLAQASPEVTSAIHKLKALRMDRVKRLMACSMRPPTTSAGTRFAPCTCTSLPIGEICPDSMGKLAGKPYPQRDG